MTGRPRQPELVDAFRQDPKIRLDTQPRELMRGQFFEEKARQRNPLIQNSLVPAAPIQNIR